MLLRNDLVYPYFDLVYLLRFLLPFFGGNDVFFVVFATFPNTTMRRFPSIFLSMTSPWPVTSSFWQWGGADFEV